MTPDEVIQAIKEELSDMPEPFKKIPQVQRVMSIICLHEGGLLKEAKTVND